MKNTKITLQILLFLAVALITTEINVSAQTPFIIKVVEKPATLSLGQKSTFAFDVQNISNAPIMMSSSCAASAGLSWKGRNGQGGGTGSGCGESRVPKSSFFTLQPQEKKRFEVEVDVPESVGSKIVLVNLRFDPNANGREYGFLAVTGEASARIKMRIK